MDEKDIYRSLKRDFFVKELEAKGIDCTGLSLEDVLILAEENNVTGINDINPEPREKTAGKIQFAQLEELFKDTNVFELMPEAKVMEDVPELKKEDFMEEFAKEMDDEISKGREEIEKSKAYLENLLKSNGIDTKDLSYTYMLDLAAKLQKDLEPKGEEEENVHTEEKHIWDDSEISKDYKEEPSETLMIKVPDTKEENHECTCEECNCDKPKEEQLTRRQKILKGFLVKELSLIESVDKEWLKNASYADIINKANEFPHIIATFNVSPEFEEYKKVTEEAINKVIDFVAGREDDMLGDVAETKINETLYHSHFPGAINEDKLREINKQLQEGKKAKEEKHTKYINALLLNKSFMQGFLYSKTDIGVLRLSNMSYNELLDECKKFVGFKNSLETRFDFIEDPEWTNTMSDIAKNTCDCAEEYTSNDDTLTIVMPKNEDILCSAIRNICEDYMCGLFPKSFETIAKSVESTRLQLTKEENSPNSNNTLSSISTKELQEELIKREGVESYWLSPDSSYTLDIGKPANSCHSAVYVNGGGPLWIIFNKD